MEDEVKSRLTQKDLVFGIYRGGKESLNPGLSIWFAGRYIWPWERKKGKGWKRKVKSEALPFEQGSENPA